MTFSALDSALTGPLFASEAMRDVFSDRALVAALIAVEAALARAEAKLGLAPRSLAPAILRIRPEDLDLAALGARTAAAGVVTIPFVKALEAKLPEKLRGALHRGATSQDILDTSLVLRMRAGLDLAEAEAAAIVAALARLAKAHRRTPMVGRTYAQHAAPVTFGFVAAIWLAGIADAAAALAHLRERLLVASLGGPVGTLAALGDKAAEVADAFARELGLAAPPATWHGLRGRLAEAGSALAILVGALAKMAADVVRLSATEVGEVSEAHADGRGGSSAMPHKRNPVSATVILAAHGVAPALAGALVSGMEVADQRAAGPWHAEWHVLPQLFGLAAGALREARRIAEGLVVDEARMRANLDLTGGLLFTDAVAHRLAEHLGREATHGLLDRAADEVRASGRPLRLVLAEGPIPANLKAEVEAAFDLAPSIDAAAAATDRILAATRTARPRDRRR